MTARLPANRAVLKGERDARKRWVEGWVIVERRPPGEPVSYHQFNPATGKEIRLWQKLAWRLRAEGAEVER